MMPVPSAQPGEQPEAPDLVPPGALLIPLRTIDFAVYTKAAVTPALREEAEQKVHVKFPGATLLKKPQALPPPTVVVFAPDREELPLPTAEDLQQFGHDLTPAEVTQAASSTGAILFGWLLDKDPTFSELRKAESLVYEVAQKTGGFVWDDTTHELFSPEIWKKSRIDGWQGDIPDARRHFSVRYYMDEGHPRLASSGLAKLGLPDFVIEEVPASLSAPMEVLGTAIAQTLAEGGAVGKDGQLALDLKALHHTAAQKALTSGAGPGATFRGHVTLAMVDPEEGDADNRIIDVRFDGYPGATEVERQAAALRTILAPTPSAEPKGRPAAEQKRRRMP
jgi:hypothetical protein